MRFTLHAGLAPVRVGGPPLRRIDPPPAGGVPLERFEASFAAGERTFTIRYGGVLFHEVVQRGEESARAMSESPGLVAPEGALLSGASGWLADVEDGGLLTFTVEALLPPGWTAVSQGAGPLRAGGAVRWESREPQQEALLVAGPLVERSRPGRVTVQTFLREDDPALADRYLAAGEGYLAMYEGLLGPYPYPKFALVENFWETGFGMPSFTLLGSQVVRFPFILHSSYPHEILHNWWGNGVFVDARRGNWCEGLTAYLADHLVAEARGEGVEHRRTALQRYADYVAAERDFPVREFRSRHSSATQAVGYDKVLMVFHMLRRKLGDERFAGALRDFYAEQRFRAATFDDLGRAMSRAAGSDLGPWLAQWIDRPGAPALRLAGAAAERRPGGGFAVSLDLEQAQPGPAFDLDVPVAVTIAGAPGAVVRTVRLRGARERAVVEVDREPIRVDVDPEHDVFRRLDPTELPPALSGAIGATRAVFVLPSTAPPEARAAWTAFAEALRRPGAEIVTDDRATFPPGAAVWVLGWENRLRAGLEPVLARYGATLSAGGLRAGAASIAREATAVVVATRSPADATQVAVFVGAPSPAPLAAIARKLPHYGKYGLLGFEGAAATNVAKQTWPVPSSPLSRDLGGAADPAPRGALPARTALAEPPLPRPPGR